MITDDFGILIVDDEPDLVSSVRRILRLDGYRVDTASSLAELLDRDNWSDYFAILLDRRLPDGIADQTILRIKEFAPSVAVIVVTAYADLDGTLAALHYGADDYFLKPLDPDHLRARLKRLVTSRRTEEALKQQQSFSQLILDTTRAVIMVLDSDSRVLQINQYFEKLCGYQQDELLGESVIDRLIPDHYAKEAERHLAVSYAESYEQGTSHPLRTKTGEEREIAWWNAPLKDEQGEVMMLVCAGLDMTEHNRLQTQLIQSERLAAIGEAMAGLAHESRNALQRSQACLDLLSEQLEDQPDSLELLESIQRAQDDLHRLYEKVRAYAAPIHVRPQDRDISEIVRKAWDDVVAVHGERNARLEELISCNDLHCEVDAFAIGQVFRNIFENAQQACSDPVEIHVDYTDIVHTAWPTISISIRDNGPGLPPEKPERVFDSFFTTKTEGTGLGMAIAQRIVQTHGGRITANSNSEQGAEFVVTLPRKQP